MSDCGGGSWVKTRAPHRCEWCGQAIEVGDAAFNYKGRWQDEWQNWYMHSECHEDCDMNYDPDGFTPYSADRPARDRIAKETK